MCVEAAYFQVHLFAKALEQTNSINTEIMRAMVVGSSLEAPQGKVSISGPHNHADLWTRVGRVNRNGQFDILEQSPGSVPADLYLIGSGASMIRLTERRT